MDVFMVGGTGLLGAAAASELLAMGHGVRSVALPPLPPDTLLPRGMALTLGNILDLSDDDLLGLMAGCGGFVFAAGVDERIEGPPPIYDLFHRHNIAPLGRLLALARQAGIRKAAILGSYFAHFDRAWPDLQLAATHPYIRSRVDQERLALSFADPDLSVAVLEIPYVFGTQPGRKPVWTFLVEQVRAMGPVTFYPDGGTAMMTVRQVGQATAGALLRTEGGRAWPLGWENRTWREMLRSFHRAMGCPGRPILTIPKPVYRLALGRVARERSERGIEPGLDLRALADLMGRKAYIDRALGAAPLGVTDDDLEAAIGDSVRLSLAWLSGKADLVEMTVG